MLFLIYVLYINSDSCLLNQKFFCHSRIYSTVLLFTLLSMTTFHYATYKLTFKITDATGCKCFTLFFCKQQSVSFFTD